MRWQVKRETKAGSWTRWGWGTARQVGHLGGARWKSPGTQRIPVLGGSWRLQGDAQLTAHPREYQSGRPKWRQQRRSPLREGGFVFLFMGEITRVFTGSGKDFAERKNEWCQKGEGLWSKSLWECVCVCVCGWHSIAPLGCHPSHVPKCRILLKSYLFMVVRGLCCCTWALSRCGAWGRSWLWCAGFSLQWLLLESTDSGAFWLQQSWLLDSSAQT